MKKIYFLFVIFTVFLFAMTPSALAQTTECDGNLILCQQGDQDACDFFDANCVPGTECDTLQSYCLGGSDDSCRDFLSICGPVQGNEYLLSTVGDFQLIDLQDRSGTISTFLGGEVETGYWGLYWYENPSSDSGSSRFGVEIVKPLSGNSEQIFNSLRGTITNFGEAVYKSVRESNDFVSLVWYSDEIMLKIGPGSSEESSKHSIDLTEDLITTYNGKFPSDVELREQCEDIGLRRESTYCSDTGVYLDQLPDDFSCLNDFECSSNVCIYDGCVSSTVWNKFLNWFSKIFGG